MHVNVGLANNTALYKKTSVWMVSPQCCNKAASEYHIQLQSLTAYGPLQALWTVLLKNCFQSPKEDTEREIKVHCSPVSQGAKGTKHLKRLGSHSHAFGPHLSKQTGQRSAWWLRSSPQQTRRDGRTETLAFLRDKIWSPKALGLGRYTSHTENIWINMCIGNALSPDPSLTTSFNFCWNVKGVLIMFKNI